MQSGYLELKIMAESTSRFCVCALIIGDNIPLTGRRLMNKPPQPQDGGVDGRKWAQTAVMGHKPNTNAHLVHSQRDVWLVLRRSVITTSEQGCAAVGR